MEKLLAFLRFLCEVSVLSLNLLMLLLYFTSLYHSTYILFHMFSSIYFIFKRFIFVDMDDNLQD